MQITKTAFNNFKVLVFSGLFVLILEIGITYHFNKSYSLEFSKQKGNIKSDEFIDWTNEQVLEEYKNAIDKTWKLKLQKELKARGVKNKQKNRGKKQ